MKSIKISALTALILLPSLLQAQTETFDIVTYQPPSGWKKNVDQYYVSYSIVDNASGTWGQLAIYSNVRSSGNPAADFSSEWKSIVKAETYAGATEPSPTAAVNEGWTFNSGASNFKWQEKDAQVLLQNISGYGLMVTIMVSTNSNNYTTDFENFLKSIQLKKPEQQVQPATQQNNSNVNPGAPIVITASPGTQGIATSTTNFDDGWVAQPFADYVRVVKQPVTVLLHYGIQIDDDMRRADNMASFFWDRLIAPRYRASNLKVFQNEMFTYNKVYFQEGDVVELSTNKNYHVGLRVLVYSGVARCIEIIAPSEAALQKEFADQAKIELMVNYNKFAVAGSDITGTWEESTSTGINMYNTVTGSYAGMNTSASANSFTLRGDGSYDSSHKGAYGMVGSMTFYDQKYKGKYTLTPWEVTMTNRFEGKTDVYLCQYEAVRGGRVLHLTDKSARGITYDLVRVK